MSGLYVSKKARRVADGVVQYFSDLPTAADHSGKIYLVKETTGIIFINQKKSGFYFSNGSSWVYLESFVADEIPFDNAGSSITAGRWYDFSPLSGTPIANAWAGTALAWTACDESTGNGTQIFGMRHGGNVSTDTKHVLNSSAITAVATGVPSQLMLVDMCGYYPGISMNSSSAQTLTGTPTLRYTNGNGVRAYLVITTASGATAHNVAMSYTDQSGNTGNTLPVTVACTASAIAGHITHSGVAANNYGPFLPLASGDYGIRSVQTVTISAASGSGAAALVLAKPILTIPLSTVGITAERDHLNQIPSLPTIPDGACLTWLYFAGAATAASTNFYGHLDFGWG